MDFTTFTFNPTVIIGCCAIGYILKSFQSFPNRLIPFTLALTGMFICIGVQGITIENIISGVVMGTASVGMHQNYVKWVEKYDE